MSLVKKILDNVKKIEEKVTEKKQYLTRDSAIEGSWIKALSEQGIRKQAQESLMFSITRVSPVQFQIYDFTTRKLDHKNIQGTAAFICSLNRSKSQREVEDELKTYPQYVPINIGASVIQKTAKVPSLWKKVEIEGKEYIVRAEPDMGEEVKKETEEEGSKKTASTKKVAEGPREKAKELLEEGMSIGGVIDEIVNFFGMEWYGAQEIVEDVAKDLGIEIEEEGSKKTASTSRKKAKIEIKSDKEDDEEIEHVMRCDKCGKIWDDDGVRVSLSPAKFYEIEHFVCDSCKEKKDSINIDLESMSKKAGRTCLQYQNGMPSIRRVYSNLLIPIARYVLKRMIDEEPPVYGTSADNFEKEIGLCDVQTDIDKTSYAIESVSAFYKDKIVQAYQDYNGFNVICYAKNRDGARNWIFRFENAMINKNQYRGKCLYAEQGSIFFRDVPDTTWEDVILDEKIKNDIRLNTVTFLSEDKMRNTKVMKRGIVMFGVPGTGKTMCCKAIFRELEGSGVSRIYVTTESFKRMGVGDLFELLKFLGPTVLAFEDIDMIGTSRDVYASNNLLGDMLTNLDGMRKAVDPLVVLASTNKLEALDAALANRPCRFDRKIELGLPTADNLKKIYSKLLGKEVDEEVIKLSKDFTGSHVVETVNTAKILGAEKEKEPIECIGEACEIIRENFFPRQRLSDIKAGVKKSLEKRGMEKESKLPFNYEKLQERYERLRDFKEEEEYSNLYEEAERIMNIENEIAYRLGVVSGEELRENKEKWDEYLIEVDSDIEDELDPILYLFFEDENFHTLNEALTELGKWKVSEKKSSSKFKAGDEVTIGVDIGPFTILDETARGSEEYNALLEMEKEKTGIDFEDAVNFDPKGRFFIIEDNKTKELELVQEIDILPFKRRKKSSFNKSSYFVYKPGDKRSLDEIKEEAIITLEEEKDDPEIGKQVLNAIEKVKGAKDGQEVEDIVATVMSGWGNEDEVEKKSKEKIPGGLAKDRPDSDFDKEQLEKGIKVEMEHTGDPEKAKEIAKDHLVEHPKYYDKLEEMEKGAAEPEEDEVNIEAKADEIIRDIADVVNGIISSKYPYSEEDLGTDVLVYMGEQVRQLNEEAKGIIEKMGWSEEDINTYVLEEVKKMREEERKDYEQEFGKPKSSKNSVLEITSSPAVGVHSKVHNDLKRLVDEGKSFEEAKKEIAERHEGWELMKEDYDEIKGKTAGVEKEAVNPQIEEYLDTYFSTTDINLVVEKVKSIKDDRTQRGMVFEKESVPVVFAALPEAVRKKYSDRELAGQLQWYLIGKGYI